MEEHSECSELALLRDVIAHAVSNDDAGCPRPLVVRGPIGTSCTAQQTKSQPPSGIVLVLAKKQIERCWIVSGKDYTPTKLSQHSISAFMLNKNNDMLIPCCSKTALILYVPLTYLKSSNKDESLREFSSFFNLRDRAFFEIVDAVIYHLTAAQAKDRSAADHLIPGFVRAAFKIASGVVGNGAAQDRIYLTSRRLSDIDSYIKSNLSRSIRVSELSHLAGYSQFHLIRIMRLQTGFSPHQYILKHRIEEARSLIIKSDQPLADIAAEVGFHNQAHFTTTFRRLTGLTPGGFRALFTNQIRPAAGVNDPHALPDLVLAAQLGFGRPRRAVPGGSLAL